MDRIQFHVVPTFVVLFVCQLFLLNAAPAQEVTVSSVAAISDEVSSLAWSSDGQWLVGGCRDSVIRLWDMQTNKLAQTIKGPRGAVRNVAFTSDGESIRATSMDRRVYTYRTSTGEQQQSWDTEFGYFSSMAVSPDKKSIWVGGTFLKPRPQISECQVALRDAATGELLRDLPRWEGHLISLSLSSDGKCIAAGHTGETLKQCGLHVHEADSGRVRFSIADDVAYSLAWSPDSRTLASTTVKQVPGEGGNQRHAGLVHLRDGATGTVRKTLDAPEFHGMMDALSFSPDGRKIVAAGMGPTRDFRDERGSGKRLMSVVTLWDVETGKSLWIYEGTWGPTQALAFSPDGKTIAFSDGGSLRLLDVATGQWREELMKFTFRTVDSDEAK
ncbi:MAG: PD40 domain-containing protein [Planctomycetaceae bacterium]|nr:PD40 domain-containing protein [Planctomycetaceae bacterium]